MKQQISSIEIIEGINKGKNIYYKNAEIIDDLDFTLVNNVAKTKEGFKIYIDSHIEFINCTFKGSLYSFRSGDDVIYTTIFQKIVRFDSCFISGKADFYDSRFLLEANFEYSIFNTQANFEWSVFSEDVIFEKAKFNKDVTFAGTKFLADANFISSTFLGDVNFDLSKFLGDGFFQNSKFAGDVCFSQMDFQRRIDFGMVEFLGNVDLIKKSNFIDVNFEGAILNGNPFNPYNQIRQSRESRKFYNEYE